MKKKKPCGPKKPSSIPHTHIQAMVLGRKLCDIGTAKRRELEGFNDGHTFDGLSKIKKEAWRAIGMYVLKMKNHA